MLPTSVNTWIIGGGGRLSQTLVERLRAELHSRVRVAEDIGWVGHVIEAQAFAEPAV